MYYQLVFFHLIVLVIFSISLKLYSHYFAALGK